jgi:hypothetical protein
VTWPEGDGQVGGGEGRIRRLFRNIFGCFGQPASSSQSHSG